MNWLQTALIALVAFSLPACDDSGNAQAAADAGSDAPPPSNHALRFDGIRDYATTGTGGFPTGDTPQTVELWVRYPSAVGTQDFITLRKDYRSGLKIGIRSGTIAAWTVYANVVLVSDPTPPTANVWHYVAYVSDPNAPNATNWLYIDGVLKASSNATVNGLTPLVSWIGTVDGTNELYSGDMDGIRIWNVARSAAAIAQDMHGATAADASGVVAYFDCDAIYGTRLIDNSGNGDDMTLGGGDPSRMPSLVPSTVPQPM